MLDLPRTPFPVTFRELWLPPSINGNATLPTSIEGGHGLTITGARKGTTCDGVHFNGAVTSNINCGAIHNAAAKLWVSFRFKLDQPFAAGSAAQFLWGKVLGGADSIYIYLDPNGRLYFTHISGGATAFNMGPPIASWKANQWYHVYAAIGQSAAGGAPSDGARVRVDNGVAVTSADMTPIPNGGDFCIGDRDDPGAGAGFEGVIADSVCGTDDLTLAEEYELYAGIPPADAVNFYPLDEGRGVTAYDRGTGGNNGTLDTSCTWAFSQVEQPILSLDGINDRGQSSAGIDISGDLTLMHVIKAKSTYNGLSSSRQFIRIYIAAGSYISLSYDHVEDEIIWYMIGGGATQEVDYLVKPVIDDYLIFIGTLKINGVMAFYVNGYLVGVETGAGVLPGGAATAYIGSTSVPSNYDVSKPLFSGLIDGAFTDKEALTFSRWLRNIYNLPIAI